MLLTALVTWRAEGSWKETTTVMSSNADRWRNEQVEFGATGIALMMLSIIFSSIKVGGVRVVYMLSLLESNDYCS